MEVRINCLSISDRLAFGAYADLNPDAVPSLNQLALALPTYVTLNEDLTIVERANAVSGIEMIALDESRYPIPFNF
jgi:hypothetical protein